MCSSYLVEDFCWSFEDLVFFFMKNFQKKIDFKVNFSWFYRSSEAVWSARRLIFWPVKIKRFSVTLFFDQYVTSNDRSKFKVNLKFIV
jgi:hypothetical protein